LPELPEVETVVADLRPHLTGRAIVDAEIAHPAIVRHPHPEAFLAGIRGRRIASLGRRGKYILAQLDEDELLVVHLGMTGQLRFSEPAEARLNHTHAVFHLDDGHQLRYRDVRRFGRLLLGTEAGLRAAGKLPRLGPEPLDADFTARDLYLRLRGRTAPLKALLLNQAVLAGVGNIYADEACFRARVRPDRPAGRLSRPAVSRLHQSLRDSLLMGIANRGTSVADYVDGWGRRGRQQEELLVYGRSGLPCPECSRPLASVRVAGRTTVFCRRCQR
jgi:formamidopyrimidine-DNA glycosylase